MDGNWQSEFYEWLSDGRSQGTVTSYFCDLGRFEAWFSEKNGLELAPAEITSFDLRDYRKFSLEHERVQPATWNRRRATLALLCQWAQTAGYLTTDPSHDLAGKKVVETGPRWLNEQDFRKLMRHLEVQINKASSTFELKLAIRDRAVVALMAYAGLRVFEVCALDISDVVISERKGTVTVRKGKGEKQRRIPLCNEARRALSEQVRVWSPTTELFMGKRNLRLQTRAVQRRLAELGRVLQIEVTPHMLRHTFCKRLVNAKRPLTEVKKLAGHARIETTAKYVTPGWDDLEAAVEAL